MFFKVEVCHHSTNSGEGPETILGYCYPREVLLLLYDVLELISIACCMDGLDPKSFNLRILNSRTKATTFFKK